MKKAVEELWQRGEADFEWVKDFFGGPLAIWVSEGNLPVREPGTNVVNNPDFEGFNLTPDLPLRRAQRGESVTPSPHAESGMKSGARLPWRASHPLLIAN